MTFLDTHGMKLIAATIWLGFLIILWDNGCWFQGITGIVVLTFATWLINRAFN